MKKNMVVILIVIGVIGVVLYLLKDRLKVLLGERVPGEEAPVAGRFITTPEFRRGPMIYPALWTEPKVPLMGVYKTPVESPARWLQEEIAPVLKPLYPARYIAITKGLLAYLIAEGQGKELPVTNGFGRIRPGNGPLVELRQF